MPTRLGDPPDIGPNQPGIATADPAARVDACHDGVKVSHVSPTNHRQLYAGSCLILRSDSLLWDWFAGGFFQGW
jgi:hypothetical protein